MSDQPAGRTPDPATEPPVRDFRHLPAPIRLDQTTTTQPASPPPPPDLGRDPDHDWLLRMGNG